MMQPWHDTAEIKPIRPKSYFFLRVTQVPPWFMPWYVRLFGVLKLPYDLIRYLLTGTMYVFWCPGWALKRYKKRGDE